MMTGEDFGLLILFAAGVLSGFWLGLVIGWFYTPRVSAPPGMVRKSFFEWLLEIVGLQRIKKKPKPLSDMVIMDNDLVIPRPSELPGSPGFSKGVILHADYNTHKVTEVKKPERKVSTINYEQE